jgi:hypothetical protein
MTELPKNPKCPPETEKNKDPLEGETIKLEK